MEHSKALLKAVRFFGSQKALGKILNVSQQRINYWINSAKEIRYEYVLKIDAYTNGYVSRYELAPDKEELNNIIGALSNFSLKKSHKQPTKSL